MTSDNNEYSNDISPEDTPHETAPEALVENLQPDWPAETWLRAVQSFADEALWRWLNSEEQRPLLLNIARGFQVAPRVLRQVLVRKRLAQTLAREPEIAALFLAAWRETKVAQSAICAVENCEDETAFHEQRAGLESEHGADAVFIAAMLRGFAFDDAQHRVLDAAPKVPESKPEAPRTDYEQKRLREQIASLKTRLRERDEALSSAKKHLETAQREIAKSQGERENAQRQIQKREADLTAQHNETRTLLERLSRKHRALENAHDEAQGEIKRLQRIVRQSQKLNEESRRQIAQLSSQMLQRDARVLELEAQIFTPQTQTVAPKKTPRIAPPLVAKQITTPQEQVFVWLADGHEVRVSPREVREAIDRNDEERVARLVQELDALRTGDEALSRRFMQAIRNLGRYYGRVLTGATTRVLVDASNVARMEKDARGNGQLQTLLAMRDELRRHDFFPILLVADASLPHHIDEPQELMKMIARGEAERTSAGIEADEILARESRRSGAYVITNDRNFHRKIAPDWEPSRIGFKIQNGVIELGDW